MSIRTWLQDPNNHLLLAMASQAAMFIPALAPFATYLQAAGATFIATGYALPEKGSLHAENYAQIAQTIAAGVVAATQKQETPGRT